MKIQTSPSLPALPAVPEGGKGHLVADIPYTGPSLVETKLGEMPQDYYSSLGTSEHSYHSCEGGACSRGGQEVWRGLPTYNADGTPKTEQKVKHLDVRPESAAVNGIVAGLCGAGAGAFLGVFGGILTGRLGLSLAIGAGTGAVLAGGIAALAASGDRIRLEWQEHPIQELTMVGYHHDTHERTREVCSGFGKDRHCHREHDGYDHRFTAKIDGRTVGTYWEPEVIHYKSWDKEQKPVQVGTADTGPR